MNRTDALKALGCLVDSSDLEKPFELIISRSGDDVVRAVPQSIRNRIIMSPALSNLMAGACRVPIDGLQEFISREEIKAFIGSVLMPQHWFQIKTEETDICCMEPPI